MTRRKTSFRAAATAAVVAAWLAAVVLPPVVLMRSRADWLGQLDRPEARSDWDAFRQDMREQSGRDGPVQRKVPRSAEPPALVWLRDYFRLAVVAWVLFTGVLGGFFCLLVAGVLGGRSGTGGRSAADMAPETAGAPRTPGAGRSLAEHHSGRHHHGDQQHDRDAENSQ